VVHVDPLENIPVDDDLKPFHFYDVPPGAYVAVGLVAFCGHRATDDGTTIELEGPGRDCPFCLQVARSRGFDL
jgi:hypothetical protein